MSKEILENLNILLEAVKAHPESGFSLENFRRDHPCGTNFCTIGLATTLPHFIEKGYELRPTNQWRRRFALFVKNVPFTADVFMLDKDFGSSSWDRLFDSAGASSMDRHNEKFSNWRLYPATREHEEEEYPHQKDLAIWRLERQIARYMAQ